MHPTLIELGPLKLHSYGLMLALGFGAALLVWRRLSRGTHRDMDSLSSMLLWLMLSGLIGARLAHVIEYWQDFAARPADVLRIDRGGLVFYGGVVGAAFGLMLYAVRRRESLLDLMDLVLVALPLGHALGRIGCLLNGCCFGRPWSGWFAIRFPYASLAWFEHLERGLIGSGATRSLPVFPTQAVEALFNLLLFALFFRLYSRRSFRGAITGLYFLLYPLQRMSIEAWRGDPRAEVVGLSIAQLISLPLMVIGIALLWFGLWNIRRQRRSAAALGADIPSAP